MMRNATIAVGLLCATSATAFEDVDGSFASTMPGRQKELASVLDRFLYDGPSARIRGVTIVDPRTICGWINAKSASGAYGGYQRFEAEIEQQFFRSQDMPQIATTPHLRIASYCAKIDWR